MVAQGSVLNYIDKLLRHVFFLRIQLVLYLPMGAGGTADVDNTADVRDQIRSSIVYDLRVVLDSLCSRDRLHRTVNKYVCTCNPAWSKCRYSAGN